MEQLDRIQRSNVVVAFINTHNITQRKAPLNSIMEIIRRFSSHKTTKIPTNLTLKQLRRINKRTDEMKKRREQKMAAMTERERENFLDGFYGCISDDDHCWEEETPLNSDEYLGFRNLLDYHESLVKHMEYLTDVIRRDGRVLELENDTVWKLIDNVVLPSIFLSDSDEQLCLTDSKRYMSEELAEEGKRRTACRLFRRIFVTSDMAKQQCNQAIRYLVDARTWWEIEAGMQLAASIRGVRSANIRESKSFAINRIFPLLQNNPHQVPLLKASCLWFLTVAAHHGDVVVTWRAKMLEVLCSVLKSERSDVVHSFGANCIREVFIFEASTVGSVSSPASEFETYVASGFVVPIIENLFKALQLPQSQGNKYLMRCLFHILQAGDVMKDKLSEVELAHVEELRKFYKLDG